MLFNTYTSEPCALTNPTLHLPELIAVQYLGFHFWLAHNLLPLSNTLYSLYVASSWPSSDTRTRGHVIGLRAGPQGMQLLPTRRSWGVSPNDRYSHWLRVSTRCEATVKSPVRGPRGVLYTFIQRTSVASSIPKEDRRAATKELFAYSIIIRLVYRPLWRLTQLVPTAQITRCNSQATNAQLKSNNMPKTGLWTGLSMVLTRSLAHRKPLLLKFAYPDSATSW